MKILYIAHITENNGATKALLNMIRSLKNDIDIAVAVPLFQGYLISKLEELNVPYFCPKYAYASMNVLYTPGTFFKKIISFFEIRIRTFLGTLFIKKIIKNYKPDLVHSNTSVIDIGYKASRSCKVPHVWHIREYLDKDFNLNIFPNKKSLISKLKSKNNHSIAITQDIFSAFGLRNSDAIIYDAVLPEKKYSSTRNGTIEPYFLFVGNIIEAKGLDEALEAFCQFNQKFSFKLRIVGSFNSNDNYFKYCQKIINKYHQSDFVFFEGFKNDTQSYMQHAIATIIPSKSEGFGFVMVEAMQNGSLVIGKNFAGIKEQFDIIKKETGTEVGLRYKTCLELQECLAKALKNDFLSEKEIAKVFVTHYYSLENFRINILKFYNSILE